MIWKLEPLFVFCDFLIKKLFLVCIKYKVEQSLYCQGELEAVILPAETDKQFTPYDNIHS
jgi:hypothetical protein